MNQTRITGPNSNPIVPDPRRWMKKRASRITTEIGSDEVSELRLDHLQALNRAEDRDRGRDDPVAEEQRGAEDAEGHQRRHAGGLVTLEEGGQRHDAAVPTVVGAHDEPRVLD